MNLLNNKLASVRRQKKLYLKYRKELDEKIQILSDEESFLLGELSRE